MIELARRTRSMSYGPWRSRDAAGVRAFGVLHGIVDNQTWAPLRRKSATALASCARYAAAHAGSPGLIIAVWPGRVTSNMSQTPMRMTTRLGCTRATALAQPSSQGQSPEYRLGASIVPWMSRHPG